jgi:hypothetical protein
MPIVLDVEQKYSYVLEGDRKKDQPPKFVFRYSSSREFEKLAALGERIDSKELTTSEAIDGLFRSIGNVMTGWSNMTGRDGEAIEFDALKLKDILNIDEANELLTAVMNQQRPSDEDLGKSEPPLPSGMAGYADSVEVSATTNQQMPVPTG